jgi:hypothetical protein
MLALGLAVGMVSGSLYAGDTKSVSGGLTAAEIASRNATARGGTSAWRAVKSLTESGKLTAGGDARSAAPVTAVPGAKHPVNLATMPASKRLKEEAQLPFVLKMERPRKTRFELEFKGSTGLQVYNGSQGWKVRPYLNRKDVEPYTADELKVASLQPDLDGPLMGCVAPECKVELEGQEKVDGRNAYKLKLSTSNRPDTHVWVDAETFLETKIEGQPRRLDGKQHPVEIYLRDYRDVNGLKFPFLMETHVLPAAGEGGAKRAVTTYPPEKIFIEKVVVNPKLNDSEFEKPAVTTAAIRP